MTPPKYLVFRRWASPDFFESLKATRNLWEGDLFTIGIDPAVGGHESNALIAGPPSFRLKNVLPLVEHAYYLGNINAFSMAAKAYALRVQISLATCGWIENSYTLYLLISSDISLFLWKFTYMVLSSAKWRIFEWANDFDISLIYSIKSKGPRVEPCGIPILVS